MTDEVTTEVEPDIEATTSDEPDLESQQETHVPEQIYAPEANFDPEFVYKYGGDPEQQAKWQNDLVELAANAEDPRENRPVATTPVSEDDLPEQPAPLSTDELTASPAPHEPVTNDEANGITYGE